MRAKTKLLVLFSIVLLGFTTAAYASDMEDYLLKGVSSRPAAMGNAFVAVSDRADSVYWNPANLALNKIMNINTVHSSLGEFDMESDMLSFQMPVDIGDSGFGFAVYRESISSIENVPMATRPAVLGYFDQSELALLGGYGVRLSDRVLVGVTAKMMRVKFLDYDKTGVGLDLGGLFMLSENLKAGVNLQNVITPEFGDDRIPFNAKLGLAYTTPDKKLLIAGDYDTNVLGEGKYHVGAEYLLVPQLALRVGADDGDLTAGVGLSGLSGGWEFDYAFVNKDYGDTHKFSVAFNFDEKPREKKPKAKVAKSEPAPVEEKTAPAVVKEEPAPPAPKKEEKKAEPKKEEKKVEAPKVEAPKVEAPAPVETAPANLLDVYTFSEGGDVVSISSTDLKVGQDLTVYKKKAKIADVNVTSVGMLSTLGKVTKLYAGELKDYMVGDQISIK